MIFACYFLACFGLSFTLAYAKITLPLRNWLARRATPTFQPPILAPWVLVWMECIACTGWWIGAVAAFFLAPPIPLTFMIWAPFLGFMSLTFNFSLGRLTRLID